MWIEVWEERDMSRWEGCNSSGTTAHGQSKGAVVRKLIKDMCSDLYELEYHLDNDLSQYKDYF